MVRVGKLFVSTRKMQLVNVLLYFSLFLGIGHPFVSVYSGRKSKQGRRVERKRDEGLER